MKTGKQRRRIAILAPNCRHGSVGAVAWRHAAELSRWFEVHVFSAALPATDNPNLCAHTLRPRRWNFLRRFCHVPNALAFEACARRGLEALCRRAAISTVWCHGHASVPLAAAPLRRRHGFRIVLTAHGDIRDRPPGSYARELTWFYRRVNGPAYRRADAVQAISPHMAELARSAGARKVWVVPHGVEPAEIGLSGMPRRAAETYLPEGIARLLFVGSLQPIKGVEALLRALAALCSPTAESAGAFRCRLTLAGGGNEQARYERMARELGLASNARFLGFVPRAELGTLYLASDVLCVPSLSEPLSVAGIEGLLCGLPLIGSRVGGLPYLVGNTSAGRLSAPGDAAELAQSIREVCASRERLAAMGSAAQERARREFAWPRIAERLRDLAAGRERTVSEDA